jgi:anti-sigma28 factor (negative regulator of flagellin synthesis)
MTASIPPSASPATNTGAVAAPVMPRVINQSATPSEANGVAKVDTVELSDRALAAQAMMQGASKSAAGDTSPELDQLTQQVASGDYHPDSQGVAAALVNFERGANKGTT